MIARNIPVQLAASLLLALALVPARPLAAQTTPAGAAEVRAVADEFLRASVVRDPAVAAEVGDATPPDRWPDRSPAPLRAWEQRQDDWLARLRRVNADALWGTPEWLTHGMLAEHLEAAAGERVCRRELWGGMDQIFGWHLGLATAAARQPVGSPANRAAALARWRDLPRFVDVEIANVRAGLAAGYAAPRDNVLRVAEQVRGMLPDSVENSPFWSPARRDADATFVQEWRAELRGSVYPALRRYLAFVETEYLPRARAQAGLSALPNGAACYRATVRALTSVDVAPEEMVARARTARAGMESELLAIAGRLTGETELRRARETLRTDPRFLFATREAKMEATRALIARIHGQLPAAFSRVPPDSLVLEAAPEWSERSRPPAWYEAPAVDGSRPGTYVLNLFGAEGSPRMDISSSVTHEAWPGHHLQIVWTGERPGQHPVLRLLGSGTGGLVEGWGMYAERLAWESGMVDDDLLRSGLLAHLTDALVGMEIDPSMHAFGLSRAAAVDSMMAISARPRAQAESYADRHAATPGQIVTYMTGYLEIMAMRDEARAALGDRFDLRAFHDVVLAEGAMPLPMLRARVRRWIADRRGV
ncbi:DUF885 domain-containing protein [Longimicrobium terrae]|uniref:Uncharacterized protein (DUF885 family) n=1 Tax=Longimicrobium terrae TaxID=1639882 RepID=A0A841H6N4_9BACT|nr:DUF885 domain-containing protein [Longimicrobium terrae]MBB4639266.1 uncharacterized protein (DUF885 family) [Longimicrobium terrae]MBB6073506.1 uncharacterized protein (DUF885 family) [Longimicrobium terrae]NNC32244.1 DUF885 domain-containing protein [Longimicrobium terrae]